MGKGAARRRSKVSVIKNGEMARQRLSKIEGRDGSPSRPSFEAEPPQGGWASRPPGWNDVGGTPTLLDWRGSAFVLLDGGALSEP
jgi:hypothetical protein